MTDEAWVLMRAHAHGRGESITFWNTSTDKKQARALIPLLRDAGQEVPEFIEACAGKGGGKGKGSRYGGGGKGKGKSGGKGKGKSGGKGKGGGKGGSWY